MIVPGLEQLADPAGDPADLRTLADAQARRLRAELEGPETRGDAPGPDDVAGRARADEREWVHGHIHDTALQILEFIGGDGFGTGLSAAKIAHLAGGAARDLRRWIESGDAPVHELVPELEQVTEQARTLDPGVRLVVGTLGEQPSGEQVAALTGAVREAVTNARKHAHASQVTVRVEAGRDGRTAVTVTDDGIGLDPERVTGGRGLGVSRSIVARMRRAGGHASLASAPDGGTRVTLVTPSREERP